MAYRMLMLVDDNEIDLMIHTKIISIAKLFDKIISFQSGEEALYYLKNNINNPDNLPQFILLDIQMPEMNGFEFLELYKALPKKFTDYCGISILSSTLDFGDIKKAEANPFVLQLIKKPLKIDDLKAVLNHSITD